MNKTINGKKENELILSPFKDSVTIEIVITDVYGEGNCLIYHFYIIMKEYIENFDMIDDPKVFVPLIWKQLKEYYTHILSEEIKNRYFIQNTDELSKLGDLYKDDEDEYKRQPLLVMSKWTEKDIKDDLSLLHSEKVDYL